MTLKAGVGLAAVALAFAALMYLAAPKHGAPIIERTVDGFRQLDSGWSQLIEPDADSPPTGWRAQVNTNPEMPAFVIYLRRKSGAPWGDDERAATLECDGRRLPLSCRRVELVEGETVSSSFLVCTGSR